jgi:hypothetical protein
MDKIWRSAYCERCDKLGFDKCHCPKEIVTQKITPDINCKWCEGTGETAERHPYGSTYAIEYLMCDCVIDQLPEGSEDDVIEIVTPGIGEPAGPEFEYDDYLDLYK